MLSSLILNWAFEIMIVFSKHGFKQFKLRSWYFLMSYLGAITPTGANETDVSFWNMTQIDVKKITSSRPKFLSKRLQLLCDSHSNCHWWFLSQNRCSCQKWTVLHFSNVISLSKLYRNRRAVHEFQIIVSELPISHHKIHFVWNNVSTWNGTGDCNSYMIFPRNGYYEAPFIL